MSFNLKDIFNFFFYKNKKTIPQEWDQIFSNFFNKLVKAHKLESGENLKISLNILENEIYAQYSLLFKGRFNSLELHDAFFNALLETSLKVKLGHINPQNRAEISIIVEEKVNEIFKMNPETTLDPSVLDPSSISIAVEFLLKILNGS